MKLYELESVLGTLIPFKNPKALLEQYPTSSHLASIILHTAATVFRDIEDCVVADLGCGTGIFTIGAVILGATHVLAIDIDREALDISLENVKNVENCNVGNAIEFIQADVLDLGIHVNVDDGHSNDDNDDGKRKKNMVDTVVMNPPFGTRVQGVDMAFLRVAIEMATRAVYSLHKTSTRAYIDKKSRSWNVQAKVDKRRSTELDSVLASTMLHSLKKKTVGLTVKSEPEPDNYIEAKARLAAVYSALEDAVARVETVDESWGHLIRDAESFHQNLHDAYPKDDHIKTLLKSAQEHMLTLNGEYTAPPDPAASHRNVIRNVKAYLAEIQSVQKEYKRVAEAKREFEIYNSKVESLEKHHKEGEKKTRNLDKLESARVTYDAALKGTLNQIDTAYNKAQGMFTAVYVAYWLSQARLHHMVDFHFKNSINYAQRHEITSTLPPPTIVEKTAVQTKTTTPKSA